MNKIQFDIMSDQNNKYYFVYFNKGDNTIHVNDNSMAELLDMTLKEYTTLTLSYGTIYMCNELVFTNSSDAQKFADYLNDKYLVILKLSGKI